MGRRERRRRQLLDDLNETKRYWKLNEKALDSTLWGARFRKTLRDEEDNTSAN